MKRRENVPSWCYADCSRVIVLNCLLLKGLAGTVPERPKKEEKRKYNATFLKTATTRGQWNEDTSKGLQQNGDLGSKETVDSKQ